VLSAEKALQLYQQACDGGDPSGCQNVQRMRQPASATARKTRAERVKDMLAPPVAESE
jgi:TPR repeat protein